MLNFSVSKEALDVFLAELAEQLDRLEFLILRLEKSADPATLQELFRITHTIKGSSASIGNENMAGLAHAMESVLDAVRGERVKVTSKLVDVLIRSLDGLKILKDALQNGESGACDVQELRSMLESFSANASLKSADVLEIGVNFTSDCEMPAVRAFQVLLKLKSGSEILHTKPSTRELKEDSPIFSRFIVQLKTSESVEFIEKSLGDIQDIAGVSVKKLENKDTPKNKTDAELMVKGELNAIRTIRVNIELFDQLMNLVGELVIGKTRLLQVGSYLMEREEAGPMGEELVNSIQHLSKIIGRLQEEVMKARLLPIDVIIGKFPRIIRDLCSRSGKEIDFLMEGEQTQLDRSVVEEIGDAVVQLLRNAVDHGIELPEARKQAGKSAAGRIKLKACHEENHVVIDIEDDGAGIDPDKIRNTALKHDLIDSEKAKSMNKEELINLIFLPGFSTAIAVSDVSGRGVGLDIVKQRIQKIAGTIAVTTEVGKGSRFHIRLPFSLAIVQGLQVSVQDRTFALPLSSVVEMVQVVADQLKTIAGREVLKLRGNVIPLLWLGECYGDPFPSGRKEYNIVIVSVGRTHIGIVVDSFSGKREFVIKTMGPYIGDLPGISGATVLADGSVGLILDVASFVQSVKELRDPSNRQLVSV